MFGSSNKGAQSYAKVGLETGIGAASPHKLIAMLYDGALVAVLSAQMHMKAGNIPEKGKSISRAMQLIDQGLRASLDKNAGGQIAENLDALYDCMTDLVHKAGSQPGFVVVLEQLPDNPRFDREVREQLLDVFRDAADFWAERKIPFRCFYSFQ